MQMRVCARTHRCGSRAASVCLGICAFLRILIDLMRSLAVYSHHTAWLLEELQNRQEAVAVARRWWRRWRDSEFWRLGSTTPLHEETDPDTQTGAAATQLRCSRKAASWLPEPGKRRRCRSVPAAAFQRHRANPAFCTGLQILLRRSCNSGCASASQSHRNNPRPKIRQPRIANYLY